MKIKIGTFLWCMTLALLLSYVGHLYKNKSLNFDSNILSLLPVEESNPAIDIAFEKFTEKNLRELFFLVKNPNLAEAISSTQQLVDTLNSSPWIEDVVFTITSDEQRSIASFNYNFRHHLLSGEDSQRLIAEEFSFFSDFVISQAYSPVSGGIIDLISIDPFLLSYRFGLNVATDSFTGLALNDGYLVANNDNQYYVLVTARLNATPFRQDLQSQLGISLDTLESGWIGVPDGSELLRTGALFYTSYAYATAQREISVIGGGSLILIVGLILFTFRSVKPIFFVIITLFFGLLTGYSIVRFFFNEVHLLTMVFGGSLIGVSVDYIFHFLVASKSGESSARLSKIFPAITLGLLSSVLGYTALVLTPFPGLQQMAVFCVSGLVAAYATVVCVFPAFSFTGNRSSLLISGSERIIDFGKSSLSKKIWTMGLLLPVIALVMLLFSGSYKEDVRQFQALDNSLIEQENQIKHILNTPASNQFYLVKGSTQEQLLINLEEVTPYFNDLIDSGMIEGFVNISQWLPSIASQEKSYSLYLELYESGTNEDLIKLDLLTEQQFDDSITELYSNQGRYLQSEQWLNSVLGKRMSHLWLDKVDEEYFAIVAIRGLSPQAVLTHINEDVLFVDKINTINTLLQSYRKNVLIYFLVAVVLIFLLLSSYFGVKKAGLVLSAPVLAVSFTICILQIFFGSINLFNVLAFFLILGIGVDFGIFFATAKKIASNTMIGIMLSALTTIFSFGVLSLSKTTVISSYGITMLIGISTVFILSPMVGALLEKNNKTKV